MTGARMPAPAERLRQALEAGVPSMRLQAAMTAGTTPDPGYVEVLIERCALEPDFAVRDMLTWALVRNDTSAVVARLLPELGSEIPQARAQALHTLSKIGDPDTWPAITPELIQDEDDEVARTAWRTAVGLAPAGAAVGLAETLATQFARGGREVQLSLSQALTALGEAAVAVVERSTASGLPEVRAHAIATQRLMADPDEGFDAAVAEARRVVALRGAPLVGEEMRD